MSAVIQTSHAPTVPERLKDATGVAFVALVLGIPMIGLTTVDEGGALAVHTRWAALALFVLVAFVGRLVLTVAGDRLRARRQAKAKAKASPRPAAAATGAAPWLRVLGWGLLGLAVALPIAFSDNRYVVDTATTVLIYVMLG